MIYINTNGVSVIDLKQFDFELQGMSTIIENTTNTWQSDRKIKEINRDTTQGLMAEYVLKQFFNGYSDSFTYVPYEKIREDGHKNNAPFDGLLMRNIIERVVYKDCKSHILKDISENQYGDITFDTRKLCRACSIYPVEIKSSQIDKKLMCEVSEQGDGKILPARMADALIRQRDIFKYPRFLRDSDKINNYYDYANYVYKTHTMFNEMEFSHFMESKLPVLECETASDIIIQVFIEYSFVNGEKIMTWAYIMGYALSVDIVLNKTIKKFYSEKSKNAIYMTLPLTKSKKIESLFYDSRLWG